MKTYLISIIAASSIATNSFAFLPFDHFNMLKNKAKSATKTAVDSEQYTDFSGTWVGKCTDLEDPFTIIIHNDEKNFSINYYGYNNLYPIGDTVKTESFSAKELAGIFHSVYYWNADKSQLIANEIGVLKLFNDASESSAVKTGIYYSVYSINNDQLVIQWDGVSFSGTVELEKLPTSICTFKKQSDIKKPGKS